MQHLEREQDRAAASALVGAGILATAHALFSAMRAAASWLYTRLSRQNVLDNDTRSRVYEFVLREPGIHASAVQARLGGGDGPAEYHLRVLVRQGVLSCVEPPEFRRYFVASRMSPQEMQSTALLKGAMLDRVLGVIEAAPGITLSALAERCDLTPPTRRRRPGDCSMPGLSRRCARVVTSGCTRSAEELNCTRKERWAGATTATPAPLRHVGVALGCTLAHIAAFRRAKIDARKRHDFEGGPN